MGATRALVERLRPGHDLVPLGDRDLTYATRPTATSTRLPPRSDRRLHR